MRQGDFVKVDGRWAVIRNLGRTAGIETADVEFLDTCQRSTRRLADCKPFTVAHD